MINQNCDYIDDHEFMKVRAIVIDTVCIHQNEAETIEKAESLRSLLDVSIKSFHTAESSAA